VRFVIRVLVNAAALWVADRLLDGLTLSGDVWQVLLIALVFGIVNAILKPILKLLSLPVLIITLGLFALVINAALLAITAGLMENLTIDGFWTAVLGALIISIVGAILNAIIPDPD
jgi:putative membrane protein